MLLNILSALRPVWRSTEPLKFGDNGTKKEGVGIDITWKTKDITIEDTKFISSQAGIQKIGIKIGKDTEGIKTLGNTFEKIDVEIKNLKE